MAAAAEKALQLNEFVKSSLGIPVLTGAFLLSIANMYEYNTCVYDHDDFKKNKIISTFWWISLLIIIFVCLLLSFEVYQFVMARKG